MTIVMVVLAEMVFVVLDAALLIILIVARQGQI
jgi:hypothetical protein